MAGKIAAPDVTAASPRIGSMGVTDDNAKTGAVEWNRTTDPVLTKDVTA